MVMIADIVHVLQTVLTLFTLYYIFISIFSFYRRKETQSLPPTATFAVVIAAHNEEKVIEELLKSIFHLDYPRELYEVFVIADNCTDNTAKIASSMGATVIERFNNRKKARDTPWNTASSRYMPWTEISMPL